MNYWQRFFRKKKKNIADERKRKITVIGAALSVIQLNGGVLSMVRTKNDRRRLNDVRVSVENDNLNEHFDFVLNDVDDDGINGNGCD